MSLFPSSKYFEILAHPIRYAILESLDISVRNFGEILSQVDPENTIGSSKLNFHLRKLVDLEIITKNEKSYFLSENGIKLLNLVRSFQDFDKLPDNKIEERDNTTFNTQAERNNYNKLQKEDLPVIIRPENLPPIISVFEYFEGKNYDFMEKNYYLNLPDPISLDIHPKTWINTFSNSIKFLLQTNKSKEWIIDRYLKLGYGTRGLQDYGLMDASISVPPLKPTFEKLIELLENRGKAGLYAKTGMGKSRNALYIANYWSSKYKTPILFIQNPNLLNETDFNKLEEVLSEKIPVHQTDPRYLLIIEDAHLLEEKQLKNLYKIIAGASSKTYSVFISFTDIQIVEQSSKRLNSNRNLIEDLKFELIPAESTEILDLNNQWILLRPYFFEWLKWVAVDVLFDLLPINSIRENTDIFHSPWSFVVSLGFLQNSLKELQKASSENNIPIILYYSVAQIYIMRGERNINLGILLESFKNYFSQELESIIGKDWENYIINLLNSWTLPSSRLLPPFHQSQSGKTLTKTIEISFYHLDWAYKVCGVLDSENKDQSINFNDLFIHLFPSLFEIWNFINQNGLKRSSYVSWLRETTRFEINNEGEIRITSFTIKSKETKVIEKFQLDQPTLSKLRPSELVNWLFIKSVISK